MAKSNGNGFGHRKTKAQPTAQVGIETRAYTRSGAQRTEKVRITDKQK